MHAYLINSTVQDNEDFALSKITRNKTFNKIIFTIAKVQDVKELKALIKSGFNNETIVVCRNFDSANIFAGNAFLKLLEEPAENLKFLLTADNLNKVLPTIRSRCNEIKIRKKSEQKAGRVEEFFGLDENAKLKFVSNIKKRDEAVDFLKSMIFYTRKQLRKNKNKLFFANLLERANITLNRIEANSNVYLQLTNLVTHINDEEFLS